MKMLPISLQKNQIYHIINKGSRGFHHHHFWQKIEMWDPYETLNLVIFFLNCSHNALFGYLIELLKTERVGFEPTNSLLLNDFESFALDLSATSPREIILYYFTYPNRIYFNPNQHFSSV